jgi:hypothetical protein
MDIRTGEIRSVAFPTLTGDQIVFLKRYGEVRKTQAGQLLFGEGDRSYDFIVILEGARRRSSRISGERRAR